MKNQKHTYSYTISRSGQWYCQGNPVTDDNLFRMLSRSLFKKDENYFVRCEGEVHPVEVTDAPLIIKDVHIQTNDTGGLEGVSLILADGRVFALNDSLAVSDENILYLLNGPRQLTARFEKNAYYRLTGYLDYDPAGYYIPVGSRKWFINKCD